MERIAELVDADELKSEWHYYHPDGNNRVRQTTNEEATITLAWTFSPEGAVVIGEKGLVTNLGCGEIYDWSTGLIFKRGRYFDPNTGIWLTMGGVMVWHHQPTRLSRRQRRQNSKQRRIYLLLLLLLIVLILTGCGDGDATSTPPDPTATCTSTPTSTPAENPTLPPPIVNTQPPQPPTPTTPPTIPLIPTDTPTPTNTPAPMAGFQLSDPFGIQGNGFYWNCFFGDSDCGLPVGNHNGIDLVSKLYIDKSCSDAFPRCVNLEDGPAQPADMPYRTVYSPVTGVIDKIEPSVKDRVLINQVRNPSRPQDPPINGLEIELYHLKTSFSLSVGTTVKAGETELGYFEDDPIPHLHLGVIENSVHVDPHPWFPSSNPPNLGPYYNDRGGPYARIPSYR